MFDRKVAALLLPLAALTCDPGGVGNSEAGADPACGDGTLDEGEQCDDGNSEDGDGCSAGCEIEYPELACVTLLETPDSVQTTVYVTPDGGILISGQLAHSDGVMRAWVGAYDTAGQSLWSLELEDKTMAQGITPVGEGFGFVTYTPTISTDLFFIDGAGNVLSSVDIPVSQDPSIGTPLALIETSRGVMLGGGKDSDLWLGELSHDGQLSTLVVQDHVGLDERIIKLARHGDTIAALAQVGISNKTDGDHIEFDTLDTWFIEYDESGQQLRKTVFSSGVEDISLAGTDLDVDGAGTWVIVGSKASNGPIEFGSHGWATAVRDGEVLWTFESSATIEGEPEPYYSKLYAAARGSDIMLAGGTRAIETLRRWSVRLDAQTGELLSQQVGPAMGLDSDTFVDGNSMGGEAWFVGFTYKPGSVEQWLCGAPI